MYLRTKNKLFRSLLWRRNPFPQNGDPSTRCQPAINQEIMCKLRWYENPF